MTCPSATWTSHSLLHREARAGRLRRSVGSSTATCAAPDGEVIEGSDGIGLRPESHTPGCEACVPVVEAELAVEPRLHVVTERDDALGVPLTERRGLHARGRELTASPVVVVQPEIVLERIGPHDVVLAVAEAEHDAAGGVFSSGDRLELHRDVDVDGGPRRRAEEVEIVLGRALYADFLAVGGAVHFFDG